MLITGVRKFSSSLFFRSTPKHENWCSIINQSPKKSQKGAKGRQRKWMDFFSSRDGAKVFFVLSCSTKFREFNLKCWIGLERCQYREIILFYSLIYERESIFHSIPKRSLNNSQIWKYFWGEKFTGTSLNILNNNNESTESCQSRLGPFPLKETNGWVKLLLTLGTKC